MISIVDYGLGNLASVKKALDFLGIENKITSDQNFIKDSDAIILPGVGSFYQGIHNLVTSGLDQLLTDEVINNNKKFLGICLGMQLIFDRSEEAVGTNGLAWIKGDVKKIDTLHLKVPHMGWNNIVERNNTSVIKNVDYYFTHSYHCVPGDKAIVTSIVDYGIEMVSSIRYNNIHAVQFHPEKSQSAGLELLKDIFK